MAALFLFYTFNIKPSAYTEPEKGVRSLGVRTQKINSWGKLYIYVIKFNVCAVAARCGLIGRPPRAILISIIIRRLRVDFITQFTFNSVVVRIPRVPEN